jgi:protein-S-isoprenylcysteine O-methyltransferase Ste14
MTIRRSPFKPPTLLLILLVAMTTAHFVLPLASVVPFPWSLGGALLVAAGGALNVVADRLFKGHGCVSACRGPDVLVTGGPYALSRNPMYLGFAFILFGIAVMLGSVSPLLVAAAFVPLTNTLFIKHEEAELAWHEAEAWSAYTARVRRWL